MKYRSVVFVIMLGWMSVSALGQTIIYTFEGTAQVSPIDNDGRDGAGLVGAAVSARIEVDANALPIDITDPIDVRFSILNAELTIAGSVGGVADGTFPVLELDSLRLINDFVRFTGEIIDALAIGGITLFRITPDSIVTVVGGIFPGTTWDTNLSLPTDFGVEPITLDLVTFGTVGQDFYRLENGSATVFRRGLSRRPPRGADVAVVDATFSAFPRGSGPGPVLRYEFFPVALAGNLGPVSAQNFDVRFKIAQKTASGRVSALGPGETTFVRPPRDQAGRGIILLPGDYTLQVTVRSRSDPNLSNNEFLVPVSLPQ